MKIVMLKKRENEAEAEWVSWCYDRTYSKHLDKAISFIMHPHISLCFLIAKWEKNGNEEQTHKNVNISLSEK